MTDARPQMPNRVTEVPEPDDLAAARGIINALVICLPFWAILAVTVYLGGCR